MTKFQLLQVAMSGEGKTHRALDAARFGRVFVIDTDRKTNSFLEAKLTPAQKEIITIRECTTVEQVTAALNELIKDEAKYATLIIDTWSEWHEMLIDFYLRTNKANRVTTKSFDGTPIEQLSQPDWQSIKRQNNYMLKKLRGLNVNLIVNAHVGTATDDEGKTTLTVGTTGSFGAEMVKDFDEVHYLHTDMNNKRQIKGERAGGRMTCKTLLSKLLDEKGNFKTHDLSIFKGLAKEVK